MAGIAATRIVIFLLCAGCIALCQQSGKASAAASLPDAPHVQTANTTPPIRTFLDTCCLPANTPTLANGDPALRFDPGHFAQDEPRHATDAAIPFLQHTGSYHASTSNTFMGRASYAASSFILTHDADGKRKLNTPYLLTVLTSAVAHSAYRPYWRRSASQPFSDFGSTVGSDAGMNVLHEFEPGILQVVKNHEPRFVSKIGAHFGQK